MAQKPSIAKGTRDFFPSEVNRRKYITDTLEKNFRTFGFEEIQTPSFEKNTSLLGKYGDEGDRLIFKILNSGNFLKNTDEAVLQSKDTDQLTKQISNKSLRYDLTVPFARFVVQHQNDLNFPFKRFQIQPVWRADRPQKGRFREFFQCDADVVGSESLWQELEFIQLYDTAFADLGFDHISIKINNRKVLSGLAEIIGEEDKLTQFTVALDKMDKIGVEGVKDELRKLDIKESALEILRPIFNNTGSFSEKIERLKSLMESSAIGQKGVEELEFIGDTIAEFPLKCARLDLDLTLARGLDYYTGAIFEILPPEEADFKSSIGGGGRYDDLTGVFGMKNLSGIGISFGLDRIYLVMEKLGLFPSEASASTRAIFINFGQKEAFYAMKNMTKLRDNHIASELYPDAAKMKKQMDYANKRAIPYVILAGSKEIEQDKMTLKNMETGNQEVLNLDEVMDRLK